MLNINVEGRESFDKKSYRPVFELRDDTTKAAFKAKGSFATL